MNLSFEKPSNIFHLHHGNLCKEHISTSVSGISGWADDIDQKCQCSVTLIALYQADYTIYTNRSPSRGTRNEGAVVVITRGFPVQPELVTTIKTKGRTFTSSYEEDAAVMESALTWSSTSANHLSTTMLFCTDSKSLWKVFISSDPCTSSIHNSISSICSSILIQW